MTAPLRQYDVQPGDVERFRHLLAGQLGLAFDATRTGQLAEVLARRAAHHGWSPRDYLALLGTGASNTERAALAEALTITETYFFRNIEQFRALAEVVLPDLLRTRAERRRLSLLSVGCASGEEAYTLAIVARDTVPSAVWHTSIVGVDVNGPALARARAGRYSPWSLRETPPAVRQRWFRPVGPSVELDERVRGDVRFLQRNVVDDDPGLWLSHGYDVIFCRNLLMYLTPAAYQAATDRLRSALAPGGYLFLGHVDSFATVPADLRVHHSHGTFYYQRRPDVDPPDLPLPRSERTPVAVPPREQHRPAAPCRAERELLLRLLREDRVDDGLTFVEKLPAQVAAHRDIQLIQAVLLVQSGQPEPAGLICERLLRDDPLNPDVHHLLAVCHEGEPSGAVAMRHHTTAAQLDTGFAMPRLRLGVLARRRGDRRAAGRELERAVLLLRHERDERVVLFGGGFGRHALIGLCRAELQLCGSPR